MPNPDVQYPTLPKGVIPAFSFHQKRCPLPMFSVEELKAKLGELLGSDKAAK